MVRRSHELADVEAEAGVPYEATRLAKQAQHACRRLTILLVMVAAAAIAGFALTSGLAWAFAAAFTLGAAWGVWAKRLGGLVAAALLAVIGALLPLRLLVLGGNDGTTSVLLVAMLVLCAACLPDVVLLLRDAELQHAYGRWARREA